MIRLNLSTEPRWVDLLPGLRLKVSPVTTAVMASARADESLSDLDPEAQREVLAIAMAKAVAMRVITDWDGVGDENGKPLPVSAAGICSLLDIWPVFEAFQGQILGPHLVLDAEKNDSAPSLTGTSAAVKTTAKRARRPAKTARRG